MVHMDNLLIMDENHMVFQHIKVDQNANLVGEGPYCHLQVCGCASILKNHMRLHFGICDNNYLFAVFLAMKSLSCVFP